MSAALASQQPAPDLRVTFHTTGAELRAQARFNPNAYETLGNTVIGILQKHETQLSPNLIDLLASQIEGRSGTNSTGSAGLDPKLIDTAFSLLKEGKLAPDEAANLRSAVSEMATLAHVAGQFSY